VSEYVAVWLPDAAVPVTVIAYVPGAAAEDVANVTVDEPPAVTEVGLKDTVTPEGAPEAERLTDCAEPEVTAVLTCAVVDEPGFTEADAGKRESEKSLPGLVVPPVNGSKV
jgi:hypothetical protein